jgi:hypothetical protein
MTKPKKIKTPIAERRGLQGSMQLPDALCAMLVRADVDQTAGALARDLKTKKWQSNVPRSELPDCDLYTPRFYPFQYRGHAWTTVVHRCAFDDLVARRLSSVLKTRAAFVSYEDTSGAYDYIAFDSGKLAEAFHLTDWQEFHTLTPAETAQVEERGVFGFAAQPYFCVSKARKLDLADFKTLSNKTRKQFGEHRDRFFDEFLRSQDAFLGFNIMDEPGREYFPLAEASDKEIARIDVIEK